MKRTLLLITFCTLPIVPLSLGRADELRMYSLDKIPQPGIRPEVIGGKEVDPKCWPSSLVFESDTGMCTATLVGPRTILTAAHCVKNGAAAHVFVFDSMLKITRCDHHDKYRDQDAYDFALCELLKPYSGNTIQKPFYENVNKDASNLAPASKVDLLGFGCVLDSSEEGYVLGSTYAATKILNRGVDVAVECSPVNWTLRGCWETLRLLQYPDDPVITMIDGSRLKPDPSQPGIALCQGDSGGSSYVRNGESRTLIGVNSKRRSPRTYRSQLATTGTRSFTEWATDWGATRDGICGLHPNTKGCRQQGCNN